MWINQRLFNFLLSVAVVFLLLLVCRAEAEEDGCNTTGLWGDFGAVATLGIAEETLQEKNSFSSAQTLKKWQFEPFG